MKSVSTNWNRDEVLAVAHLGITLGWPTTPPRAKLEHLSAALQAKSAVPTASRKENFRSPDAVGRKYDDIRTALADYGGVTTKGGRTTAEVALLIDSKPHEARELASKAWSSFGVSPSPPRCTSP